MASILVVADDLTGANACAAGFAQVGLRTVTVGLEDRDETIRSFRSQYDVVVATTESRHVQPVIAARAMRDSVAAGWPVDLVSARIDTTLRGNVGVAAQGLIDSVTELSGRRAVGLCVPAFPQAGRVTVDGQQLLNGKRLEDTELARDVRSPVTTSDVSDILKKDTILGVARVPMSVSLGDHEMLVDYLVSLMKDATVDVIVGDALTTDHIDIVARASVEAAEIANVELVCIDPGPASLSVARAKGLTNSARPPLLAVSGSSTDVTMEQLKALIASKEVDVVRPVLDGDLPNVDDSVRSLVETIESTTARIVLWASVLEPSDIRDLSSDDARALPGIIGHIVESTLTKAEVDGLYTTGGDITAAVLEALGARGIEIEDEVMPLAVMGSIVGGQRDGMPIVTKGGLIGDATGAIACLDYLDQQTIQRARWVHHLP